MLRVEMLLQHRCLLMKKFHVTVITDNNVFLLAALLDFLFLGGLGELVMDDTPDDPNLLLHLLFIILFTITTGGAAAIGSGTGSSDFLLFLAIRLGAFWN